MEIRERRNNGETYDTLAYDYKVNQTTIKAIIEYQTYKDVY